MHILISGYFYLPTGMASSARIRNIAYGFKAAGATVSIIALKQFYYEQEELQIIDKMKHDGINVNFIFDGKENHSIVDKILLHRKAGKIALAQAKTINQTTPIDALFLYGVSYYLHKPLLKFAKQVNATTLIDIVEHRVKMLTMKHFLRDPHTSDIALGALKTHQSVDIICAISQTLLNKNQNKKYSYLLPGIENWNNSPVTEANKPNGSPFNLLYIGILSDRDDPAYLIELFQKTLQSAPQSKLTIVGNYMASPRKDHWVKLMQKQFGDSVYVAGKVTEKEMARLKSEASGFILTRKNNLPEICAFPTRLLEFLKMKKPVFISDVGDIPNYLEHMKDACILNGDLEDDCNNILKIINDEQLAQKIGQVGFTKGSKVFDRNIHMAGVFELIENFQSSNK